MRVSCQKLSGESKTHFQPCAAQVRALALQPVREEERRNLPWHTRCRGRRALAGGADDFTGLTGLFVEKKKDIRLEYLQVRECQTPGERVRACDAFGCRRYLMQLIFAGVKKKNSKNSQLLFPHVSQTGVKR